MSDVIDIKNRQARAPAITGTEFSQLMLDAGFMAHIMKHLEGLGDAYRSRGDEMLACLIYDSAASMVKACTAISEKARELR